MQIVDADTVHLKLGYIDLIDRLRSVFAVIGEMPARQHYNISRPDGLDATLLIMPAWRSNGNIAIKILSVFPENARKGYASIHAQVVLMDGNTGATLAIIEGGALTVRRTACASALASSYLARQSSSHLLMVGAGALAPHLIGAHATVRPIKKVSVSNRTPEKARSLVSDVKAIGLDAHLTEDLEADARIADVISCATMSSEPLIRGEWLKPGCHLDLVGAFRPDMRESDNDAVCRARLFVDTRIGALAEGGDIVQPLTGGIITECEIVAELSELCRGSQLGRETDEEITLFKSVGSSIEDLAAAELVFEKF